MKYMERIPSDYAEQSMIAHNWTFITINWQVTVLHLIRDYTISVV